MSGICGFENKISRLDDASRYLTPKALRPSVLFSNHRFAKPNRFTNYWNRPTHNLTLLDMEIDRGTPLKKKLLFVVNVDWFFVSHRLPIALRAIEDGFDVHIICSATTKISELEALGLTVHPLSFSRSGTTVLKELTTAIKLFGLIRKISPDIVHLITIKPVIYGGIIARMVKVPSLVSAISGLGFLFVERTSISSRMRRYFVLLLYRIAMNHSNQSVILQNPTDMRALVESGGLDKRKARMIKGSGIDLNEYPMTPEPNATPVVVMASRLLIDKGVNEFVEAAKIIKRKGIEARFQLVGEPDLENPESISKEQFNEWQQGDDVECLGFRTDVARIFSQAHIVTLPSYYGEGLPKVLIEAAACARAVVTTDNPGCRDAIEPNVTGLLVAARDSQELADAIEILIRDRELRVQMGKAGRALAERDYDIEDVVKTHIDIYNELDMNR